MVIIGPSTPILFKYRVKELSGFIVGSRSSLIDAVAVTEDKAVFEAVNRSEW